MLKSLILLFVHLISLCCPVLFQDRPIDSLNRTSYNNCQQKIIHSARSICADACISSYIYIYKEDFAQQYDKCGARSGSPQLHSRMRIGLYFQACAERNWPE